MNETQQPIPTSSGPKAILWIGVVVVIVIGLGVGAYFAFFKNSGQPANTAPTTNATSSNSLPNQSTNTNTERILTDEEKTAEDIPKEFTVKETVINGEEVKIIYPPSNVNQ